MRRIFLDIGSHKGETVSRFRQHYPGGKGYEIHCFEPNVSHAYMLAKQQVILHPEAAWTHDGTVDFFIAREDAEGCTLLRDKTTGNIDRDNPIRVPCLRLSRWLLENVSDSDFVVMKLNVEGAEYAILDDIIRTNATGKINQLYVEWHLWKVGVSQEEQDRLITRLSEAGVKPVSIWGLNWLRHGWKHE